MSLEHAIMRRVRLGQSFCSYSFKKIKKTKGHTLIQAQRNHSYLSNLQTIKFLQTAQTICLSASHLKSTTRQSSHRQQKQNQLKLQTKTKTPSIKPSQITSTHSSHSNPKPKLNKMDEYLSDFNQLRSEFQFKSNKYQNIPKYHPNPTPTEPQKNYHPFLNNYTKIQSRQIIKKQFNSEQMLEMFYDFSLDQNSVELPFTVFRLVHLGSMRYMETSIGEKLFSEIPIKEYCHVFNHFATRLEENIFYLGMSKDKLEDQSLRYTQCFFWISKPIKHNQRIPTLKNILKFYAKCLKQISLKSICPKIWIVDYNGRISYMNKQQIIRYMQDPDNRTPIKFSQVHKNSQINQVCLTMFLASMKRGNFSHARTSVEAKFMTG